MQKRRRLLSVRKQVDQLGLAGFERSDPILQLGAGHAVEDRLDRFVELAVHALQFAFARLQIGPSLAPKPICYSACKFDPHTRGIGVEN
ncbi:hypothetical protein [Methylosinus sp. PW1]|uniref:hypothetical protein n=1 Tax=Methylosinus sp. PW1 TaxID=107636 RepID=UPI00056C15D2|nr:hypothetical protein [Methylosinus sp. PW1]